VTDYRLTPAEQRAYREDGFFVRNAVFSRAEIQELRDAVERCAQIVERAAQRGGEQYKIDGNRYVEAGGSTIQFEHAPGSETVRVVEPFHHLDERIDRLIDDGRFVDPARDLCESDRVSLFTDKLNLKRPLEGSRFRWHQDSPYWAHFFSDVDHLPNLMLALDNATIENGCLRIVRGSHRNGMLPGLEGEGQLGPLFTDPSHFDAADGVPAVLAAGDMLFFHPSTVHGSEPNTSDRLRRAFLFTYQPGSGRMFKVDAKRVAGETGSVRS
jgi:ectoine hydroxylase